MCPARLNKGRGSKVYVGFQVWQETLEEGQRTYQLKCKYNKDEDNSPEEKSFGNEAE